MAEQLGRLTAHLAEEPQGAPERFLDLIDQRITSPALFKAGAEHRRAVNASSARQ